MSNVLPFRGPAIAKAPVRLVPDPDTCPAQAIKEPPTDEACFDRMLANVEAQCAIAHVTRYGSVEDLKELRDYINSCIATKS